jgi:prepilin-type processing-associated H-X9-DG protein
MDTHARITASSVFKTVVVVCILLFLYAVFIQLTAGEIQGSPGPSCLSNLKQVGLGFALYTNGYDDRLPPSAGWMDLLQPYMKNEQILHCPMLMPKEWKADDDLKKFAYGYAMNRFLALADTKHLAEPEKMPLAYETVQLGRSASGYLADVPNPGRHKGKNTFLFADFHAKAFPGQSPQL